MVADRVVDVRERLARERLPGDHARTADLGGSFSFTSGKYAPAGNLLLCSITSNVAFISSAVSGSSGLTAAVVVVWATACRVRAGVPLTMPAPASTTTTVTSTVARTTYARADGLGQCRDGFFMTPSSACLRVENGSAPQCALAVAETLTA